MIRRLQDWLTEQAAIRPDARAIVFHHESVTYGELEESSNRLARALKAAGCVRGDRVALLLPKSPKALIAIFASLKADCMYVPLDTASPAARIARILESCESRCVLADQSTGALLRELSTTAQIGWMDGDTEDSHAFSWNEVQSLPASPVDSRNVDTDGAHILFTSGSTGAPKGVVITHANVISFIEWAIRYFGTQPSDRISGHPPLHFDLSTFDIHGTIAAGAELHLLSPEASLLPHRLAQFIRESELTQWFSVPSVLHHMAKFDAVRHNDFSSLRRLLWCGEKFPTPALMYWMRRIPHTTFTNLYGPTEATIASSYYQVPECPTDETGDVPIGSPCGGEHLMVLDDRLQPTARGRVGDLYIAGAGLSPGYWRDQIRTDEVFISNPDAASPWKRLYKTGDLARIGTDGMIYLLGRSDSQIKTRGYRIELGEIETAVHAVPGVQDAAVVAIEANGFEGTAICCAYVPSMGNDLSPIALKKELARVLPHYMLPSRWLALERMPLNGNGKIARPRLREQFLEQSLAGLMASISSPGKSGRDEEMMNVG